LRTGLSIIMSIVFDSYFDDGLSKSRALIVLGCPSLQLTVEKSSHCFSAAHRCNSKAEKSSHRFWTVHRGNQGMNTSVVLATVMTSGGTAAPAGAPSANDPPAQQALDEHEWDLPSFKQQVHGTPRPSRRLEPKRDGQDGRTTGKQHGTSGHVHGDEEQVQLVEVDAVLMPDASGISGGAENRNIVTFPGEKERREKFLGCRFPRRRQGATVAVLVPLLLLVGVVAFIGGYCGAGKCSADDGKETMFPTMAPTTLNGLTQVPTSEPPEPVCALEVDVTCTFNEGAYGQTCDNIRINLGVSGNEDNSVLPIAIKMLYFGGDCSISGNIQVCNFTCEDMNGGPPLNEGEESRIVVTDTNNSSITYFDGIVAVGTEFDVTNGGFFLGPHLTFTILSPDDGTVYQVVTSDSQLCGSLGLLNFFGSLQLTERYDPVNGVYQSFYFVDFALSIGVPADASGGGVVLSNVIATSSAPNTDDQYLENPEDYSISPGETTAIILPFDLNTFLTFTEPFPQSQPHIIFVLVQATRILDGAECTASESVSFTITVV